MLNRNMISDDLLNIDHFYFEQTADTIYPKDNMVIIVAADNLFFFFFREYDLAFHVNRLLAVNSHEMPSHILLGKRLA